MIKKYLSLIISILFVVTIVFALWLFPPATPVIGIGFFLFGLAVTISAIFKRQRRAYLQDKITHGVFMRNIFVEIIGILLAMVPRRFAWGIHPSDRNCTNHEQTYQTRHRHLNWSAGWGRRWHSFHKNLETDDNNKPLIVKLMILLSLFFFNGLRCFRLVWLALFIHQRRDAGQFQSR